MPTTKHTHEANFGRRVSGCPRCAELEAGAPVRQWHVARSSALGFTHPDDARQVAEIRAHFSSAKHKTGGCGPVCTFGEW